MVSSTASCLRNVYPLPAYLQASNLGELFHYYEETGAQQSNLDLFLERSTQSF